MLFRSGMGSQFSGSVGGVTAARNAGGQYLRNRTVPVNPNTNRQQVVRQAFSAAAAEWKALTEAQREAWVSYADQTPVLNRLGETITLSGFGMFVRTNAFIFSSGGSSFVTSAPSSPGIVAIGSNISITPSVAGFVVTGVNSDLDDRGYVAIGPVLSAGVTFFRGPYTLWSAVSDFAVDLASGVTGTESVNRYGVPAAGERRSVKLAAIAGDGRLSTTYEEIVEFTT